MAVSVTNRCGIALGVNIRLIERGMCMWPTLIIVLLLGAYVFYVVRKRVREIKAGKFCSCGCADCPSHCGSMKEYDKKHRTKEKVKTFQG